MEHLRYLFGLLAEGKLLLNGPVSDESDLKGIGIFRTTDVEKAKRLLEEYPAVQSGRLACLEIPCPNESSHQESNN